MIGVSADHRMVERSRTPKPLIYRVTYNYRVDAVKMP
jgi:hypothetical protein